MFCPDRVTTPVPGPTVRPPVPWITPEIAAHLVRAVIGDTKPDPALIQPVIDVAVKYGGMQSLPASEYWAR